MNQLVNYYRYPLVSFTFQYIFLNCPVNFPFLMHNINIWYTIGITENNLCGKLINQKYVDKCILFTMRTDTYIFIIIR